MKFSKLIFFAAINCLLICAAFGSQAESDSPLLQDSQDYNPPIRTLHEVGANVMTCTQQLKDIRVNIGVSTPNSVRIVSMFAVCAGIAGVLCTDRQKESGAMITSGLAGLCGAHYMASEKSTPSIKDAQQQTTHNSGAQSSSAAAAQGEDEQKYSSDQS